MSQFRGTRRGTRPRRTRGRRYTALDYLMLAGIVGGGAYVILTAFGIPVPVAAVIGVLGAGFYLGAAVGSVTVRSPLVWRRGR